MFLRSWIASDINRAIAGMSFMVLQLTHIIFFKKLKHYKMKNLLLI